MRTAAKEQAFQLTLFSDGKEERVKVGEDYEYEFHPDHYSPGSIFARGGEMRHHYYPQVGGFDSAEEEACAWHLEHLCDTNRLSFWVRNLTRKGSASFFLQKASDRFYPDFIAKLSDGRTLLVEYKGKHLWDAARDDRAIGELWEEMSGGHGLFVMVSADTLGMVDAKLDTSPPPSLRL
jgi:type III restriction enzyme